MRKVVFIVLSIIICSISVKGQSIDDIHLTPEILVQKMFKAIAEKDNCVLRDLIDPEGESTDGDARSICGMLYLEKEQQEDMQNWFRKAYISGSVTYETVDNVSYAYVPIVCGPNNENAGTIELVNRKSKWFLLGL